MENERRLCALRPTATALVALLLAACGGGGADEQGVQGGALGLVGYHLATASLPAASAGEIYAPVQLAVTQPQAHGLQWRLWQGSLPAGIELTDDGLLHGRPQETGFFEFGVHVTDGLRAGTGRLALAVDAFGVFAQSGLVGGDAWSGRDVTVRAVGQEGHVSFSLVENQSGAQLLRLDGAAGTVIYRAGWSGGSAAQDLVRVTDLEGGRTHELVLDVRPDPTAGHRAEFGSTDVWYVNMENKVGAHPYATDMHAVLSDVGLRGTTSYDMLGTEADHLAMLWVRLEVLRKVNVLYRRSPDGSAGASGLPVSFPFSEPGSAFRKPSPGGWINGGSTHFSQLSLLDGRPGGVVGTAFVDDGANTLHENNTTSGPERLGVFLNVIGSYFSAVYPHDALRSDPIGPSDIDALRALLTDQPSPGGRYDLIRQTGRDFARVVATVVAHEIGHSLGLEHTSMHAPGESIMGASAAIAPWSNPQFLPADVARLASRLPGPGRFGGGGRALQGAGVAAATVPAGGVCACEGRKCHLRIAVPGDER